jgi:hypothetical protein
MRIDQIAYDGACTLVRFLACTLESNLLLIAMIQHIKFSLATIALTGLPLAAEVAFNRDIRPILSGKCFADDVSLEYRPMPWVKKSTPGS